jgi:hypothetical protein
MEYTAEDYDILFGLITLTEEIDIHEPEEVLSY